MYLTPTNHAHGVLHVIVDATGNNSKSILDASFSLVTVTVVIQTRSIDAEIAQLGERQTEDLKAPGLNPENSHEFLIIPGLGNFF